MSFSKEIREKIYQFAKEQSQHYLEEAEMTYLEKLRRKTGETKSKVTAKLAKLKNRSERALEAQNDMILYMSDYMNDLIAEGYSEQEAFKRAKEELRFRSETAKSADLQERFTEYYLNLNPADYEAVGLFYAGFLFFGIAIGTLTGFLGSGGRAMFLAGGWIDTLIGTAVGITVGIALGLISNAIISLKKRH
ncbi:hypothetical protein Desde_1754 [Desulfitobacterium dehalogenans ATCC 51507]|uniref:Uncharacterized protein n=1 Tax=Desulfitobacterium dehalogenans (strain ATCC 51507 / DSM 9161 / JW/IU-DC1) TaxID=756499 RepID=I4A865_DESDJ|nr:hypothetical protein [Desulfitobacterium dehalogenans]AFM00150.1 hypothetical protein Desde_1754 [Desulfitobacterium dehalogenans ATCC 51507]